MLFAEISGGVWMYIAETQPAVCVAPHRNQPKKKITHSKNTAMESRTNGCESTVGFTYPHTNTKANSPNRFPFYD